MPKTFEPFLDSSGFFSDVCQKLQFRKSPEAVLLPICFANNAGLDFGGLIGKKIARFCGLIPLKKPERDASVSHLHACCLDVFFPD